VHRRRDHPRGVEHHGRVARGRRSTLALACALSTVLTLAPGAHASSASYFSGLGVRLMMESRASAVAAPLPNGEVLIAGGLNGGVLSSTEVFNPQTNTFANETGTMTTPRYGAVAAPLPNGEVLIAGGSSSFASYLSSAELFNPANGMFASVPGGMTTQRYGAVAAPLPNGEVLIAGGYNSFAELSNAELFNPQTGTFTSLPGAMTISRQEAMATALPNGEVLIAGGQHGGVLSSAELFDPASGTFTSMSGTMTTARYAAMTAPLPDGTVLIAGGENGGELSSAELFDPASSTFTSMSGAMTEGREGAMAAPLSNGEVLVAGGYENGTQSFTAELFYPAPEVSSSGGTFGDQTVGESSALQTIRVSNLGAQALTIAAAKLEGGDAADFAISANGCEGRRLPFEGSCTISVRFTPSEQGARVASLMLADNEATPSVIDLAGTGVPANSGPTGPTGATGPQGAAGASGPQGATGVTGATGPQGTTGIAGATGAQGPTGIAGAMGPAGPRGAMGLKGVTQIVTCYTVTTSLRVGGHKTDANHRVCSTVPASAKITLTGNAGAARAKLERGRQVYAVGTGILTAHGHLKLLLSNSRTLKPGAYTLILVRHRGARWVTTRAQVTIG
jgi:Collagen triple helix repeat (20 copies)/Abnormal spindle-like microcephaly-assoc'd, ASPM-SPD-2-Hydin/Galactose oxidase, central domain